MKQMITTVIWKTRKKKTCRQSSKKKKEFLKNEGSLRNILDNMNCNNIRIIRIPERKERENKGLRTYLKK